MRDTVRADRPGPLTILGLALLVGLLGGLLFAVRDSVRAVLEHADAALVTSYAEMAAFGLYAALRYVAVGCALMAVVGAMLAVLELTRRRELSVSRAVYGSVAVLVFTAVSMALLVECQWPTATPPGVLYTMGEVGTVSILSALGACVLVAKLRERLLGWWRVVTLGLALVAALAVVGNWGLWLSLAASHRVGVPGLWLGGLSVVVAALLAAGLWLLIAPKAPSYDPSRRRALGAGLTAAAGAVVGGVQWAVRERRAPRPARHPALRKSPNVLWIVMDTARADALSCYGCPRETTPRIDALAAGGVLYERAIAQAPWTLPSHAAMFTGLLPSRISTTAEHQWLDGRFTTLAEALAGHGYRTLGYSNNNHINPIYNLAQGFHRLKVFSFGRTWRTALLANRFHNRLHLADYGARETTRIVQRWTAQCASAGQPFFVFINFMEAHRIYGVTPLFRRWLPKGVSPAAALAVSQSLWQHYAGTRRPTAEGFRLLRALYDGDVTYLDQYIGLLVDHLERLNILDETLIVLTSDHGEHFGEHGHMGHHFSLYQELLHVPLVLRYPAAFPPGTRVENLVETTDIFPTILDAAGVPWEGKIACQGRSLLRSALPAGERYAVSEYAMPVHIIHNLWQEVPAFHATPFLRRLKAIQSREYKYIWASDGKDELYNLRRDPGEQHNLIRTLPGRARELKARLQARVNRPLRRLPL